jgi:O-antigen ligase
MHLSLERESTTTEGTFRTVLWVVSLFIFIAPFNGGSNRPVAYLYLEAIAVVVIALTAWHGRVCQRLNAMPRLLLAAIGVWLVTPVLQLLPLPVSLVEIAAARELVREVWTFVGHAPGWATISIYPAATELSALLLLVPLAAFLVGNWLPWAVVRKLLLVWLGVVLLQATLGLLQVGGLRTWSGTGGAIDIANGMYPNRNHLAGLLAMSIPIWIALVNLAGARVESASTRQREAGVDRKRSLQGLGIGAALIVGLALIFTRSRAGIACGVVAFAFAYLTLAMRSPKQSSLWVALAGFVTLIALAVMVGMAPVIDRFNSLEDLRPQMLASSFDAGLAYLPFGSGLGTFPDAHQPFQHGHSTWVDFAHNDYVHAFVEGGLLAVLMVMLAFVAYGQQCKVLVAQRFVEPTQFVQGCAGVSVLAMAMHSLVDFNLRIPANALYFSFLAGIFFRTVPAVAVLQPRKRARMSGSSAPADPYAGRAFAVAATIVTATLFATATGFADCHNVERDRCASSTCRFSWRR